MDTDCVLESVGVQGKSVVHGGPIPCEASWTRNEYKQR
jgi:hypothetical protein